MRRTLLVTNDFPPRLGGIQTFLQNYASRLPAEDLVVYASSYKRNDRGGECASYDATVGWKTYRDKTSMLLPTPRVARKMAKIVRDEAISTVWFGAAAPLGLLAQTAKAAGASNVVVTTHGHEIGWTLIPGARQLVKKIFADTDAVTYISDYTLHNLKPAIGNTPVVHLPGGIDTAEFRPNPQARAQLRQRYQLGDRPVILCLSRLVPRTGQDMLIRAMEGITKRHPEAHLVITGSGPYENHLKAMAKASPASANITFTGAIPAAELAAHHAMADIFAMPARTRWGGLDVEGLGIVYLEAGAAAVPVIAGDSGGAPETVLHGQTGYVVKGTAVVDLAMRICQLLENDDARRQMGWKGREYAENWAWPQLVSRLTDALDGNF